MRRIRPGPVLLSVAVHAAVVVALLVLRAPDRTPEPPRIVIFELLQMNDFVDTDGAFVATTRPRASRTGPNTLDEIELPEAAVPASRLEVIDPDALRGESAPQVPDPSGREEDPRDAAVAVAASDPDTDPVSDDLADPQLETADMQTSAIEDPAAEVASLAPYPDPVTPANESLTDRPDLIATEESTARIGGGAPAAAARVPAGAVPDAAPVPRTRELEPGEQRMLEGRLRRWSERLDTVDEGTPQEWTHQGRAYTASFTRLPAGDDMGLDELLVEISTGHGADRLATEVRLRRLAFSSFAQFVDYWDPGVQMHDDEIDGRFHSNSEIYVSPSRNASPSFNGLVTTARGVNTSFAQARFRATDVFRGGLETRAGTIPLPSRMSAALAAELLEGGLVERFESDTRIVFEADGSYRASGLEAGAPVRRRFLPAEGRFHLIAADRASLYLSGRVRGQILVYAPQRIVIEGDLTYASPAGDATGDGSYLGLVAERSVEIAEPAVTGPGDLEIHAAIFARGRFSVRRYSARDGGTLTIFGSLAAGTLSPTEPRYRTRVRFDSRLEHSRPPSYPLTDRYEVSEWDSVWLERPAGP
jgi:hypothetical protein